MDNTTNEQPGRWMTPQELTEERAARALALKENGRLRTERLAREAAVELNNAAEERGNAFGAARGYLPVVEESQRVASGIGAGGVERAEFPKHIAPPGRILAWFSCGAASAVALKLAVEKYGADGVLPLYCGILQEHDDNGRFCADVEKWLGVKVATLVSEKYGNDIYAVFRKERYISGIGGARCTRCLKRDVRKAFQQDDDTHIFGYTADESKRVATFERNNPTLFCEWLLVDAGINKADCYRIIQEAGIRLPTMYLLGYKNNNCIGCVKGGARSRRLRTPAARRNLYDARSHKRQSSLHHDPCQSVFRP